MKITERCSDTSTPMSRHDGMHFLCVDDHQAGGMKKCMMSVRRRSMREL